MPMPSTALTRLDLSSTFTEFDLAASRMGFIGPQVLRPRLVGLQSADVGKLPIEALLQAPDTSRARGAGYRRGTFEFTKFNYSTNEFGWEEVLDERDLALYRDIIDAEGVSAQRAVDFVLRSYEVAVAAKVYDTSVWTGASLTTALTNEWDDKTNATPIEDIEAARLLIQAGSGLMPNALIMNRKQYHHLRNCDQMVNRIKYAGFDDPKSLSRAAIAEMLELDMIIVAGGDNIKNTAKEGQDVTTASIWSDEYMMLAKVATSDDPREPCVGRTFIWTGDGVGAAGTAEELAVVIEQYREEKVRGDIYRVRTEHGLEIMYPQAAHLLSNAITI